MKDDDSTDIIVNKRSHYELVAEGTANRVVDKHQRSCKASSLSVKQFLLASLPLIMALFIFGASIHTRLHYLEQSVPTKLEVRDAVDEGVSRALNGHNSRLKQLEEEIRSLQIKLSRRD